VAARRARYSVAVVESPALALDLDTVDDLWALLEWPGSATTAAGRLLHSLALRERLAVDR
jgi:2-phospho-L-lactate guanylyltransferase (CobY/MobA/RfbA family)